MEKRFLAFNCLAGPHKQTLFKSLSASRIKCKTAIEYTAKYKPEHDAEYLLYLVVNHLELHLE